MIKVMVSSKYINLQKWVIIAYLNCVDQAYQNINSSNRRETNSKLIQK